MDKKTKRKIIKCAVVCGASMASAKFISMLIPPWSKSPFYCITGMMAGGLINGKLTVMYADAFDTLANGVDKFTDKHGELKFVKA